MPATTKGGKILPSATGADAHVGGDGAAGGPRRPPEDPGGPPRAADQRNRAWVGASQHRASLRQPMSLARMAPAIMLHLGVDFELVRYRQFFGEEMRSKAREAGSGIAPWMIVNDVA